MKYALANKINTKRFRTNNGLLNKINFLFRENGKYGSA